MSPVNYYMVITHSFFFMIHVAFKQLKYCLCFFAHGFLPLFLRNNKLQVGSNVIQFQSRIKFSRLSMSAAINAFYTTYKTNQDPPFFVLSLLDSWKISLNYVFGVVFLPKKEKKKNNDLFIF